MSKASMTLIISVESDHSYQRLILASINRYVIGHIPIKAKDRGRLGNMPRSNYCTTIDFRTNFI